MAIPKSLTVLYDAHCAFCQRCKQWLELQPQRIPLTFIPYDSPLVNARFPQLNAHRHIELTVISDTGEAYYSDKAFIMCLYALHDYHLWSEKLASPLFRPLVRNTYEYLSRFRQQLSRLFKLDDRNIIAQLQQHQPTEYCSVQKQHD